MADPVLTPRWYLQPGTWPHWLPDAFAAFAAPRNDALIQNSPWPESTGGILGGLLQADRGKIGASRAPRARGNSRPAYGIVRQPKLKLPQLAADAFRPFARSDSAAKPAPAATDVADDMGLVAAIESFRTSIRSFRFGHALSAADGAAAGRK
jgi:hypothetical protein